MLKSARLANISVKVITTRYRSNAISTNILAPLAKDEKWNSFGVMANFQRAPHQHNELLIIHQDSAISLKRRAKRYVNPKALNHVSLRSAGGTSGVSDVRLKRMPIAQMYKNNTFIIFFPHDKLSRLNQAAQITCGV